MSESREYYSRSEPYGDVYISEEVLEMIAGAAALEVEGVTGLAGGTMSEQLLGRKKLSKGLRFFGSLIILPSMYPFKSAMVEPFRRWPERYRRPLSPAWKTPAGSRWLLSMSVWAA